MFRSPFRSYQTNSYIVFVSACHFLMSDKTGPETADLNRSKITNSSYTLPGEQCYYHSCVKINTILLLYQPSDLRQSSLFLRIAMTSHYKQTLAMSANS